MSERYTKLFSLPNNLYTPGSPVLISAGALLKDNSTGKVISQLKLKNISNNLIKAVTIRITPFNTVGKPLGDTIEYTYLDLNEKRDAEFCQKVPVLLPDEITRSFSVSISEVIFSDNSIWEGNNTVWNALLPQAKLISALKDPELVKQFRIEYGQDCEYEAASVEDLWYCTCGAINHQSELTCHKCKKNLALISSVDLRKLIEKRDKRLEQEKKAKEESDRLTAEKKKKTTKILVVFSSILVACITFIIILVQVIIPSGKYRAAEEFINEDKYDDAIEIFTELGDYKDSSIRLQEAKDGKVKFTKYVKAKESLDNKSYAAALEELTAIGSFKDSVDLLERAKEEAYPEAKRLLGSGDYEEADTIFSSLGNYKDSADICSEYKEYELVCNGLESNINNSIENAFSYLNGCKYYKANKKDNSLLASVKQIQPFCGYWTYVSGDDLLSYSLYNHRKQVFDHINNKGIIIKCLPGIDDCEIRANSPIDGYYLSCFTFESFTNDNSFSATFEDYESDNKMNYTFTINDKGNMIVTYGNKEEVLKKDG